MLDRLRKNADRGERGDKGGERGENLGVLPEPEREDLAEAPEGVRGDLAEEVAFGDEATGLIGELRTGDGDRAALSLTMDVRVFFVRMGRTPWEEERTVPRSYAGRGGGDAGPPPPAPPLLNRMVDRSYGGASG